MLKESLMKLRSLVDCLEDRDKALKQDHDLFEKFFDNFPIPVSMWSVNAEGKVLSCKGNGFLNEIAKTEDDLFICDEIAGKIETAKSEQKDVKEMFIETETSTYFAKILTRRDGNDIIGTIGMAWDVSSNITMLGSLIRVRDTASDTGNIDEIKSWAENGIAASKMRVLIERMTAGGK
jgi:hypothetical protein